MEETATVWSLLKSDLRPIEDVVAEFNSKFPRDRRFTACNSLSLLLQARAPDCVTVARFGGGV